jgi:nicotinate dehydrogenase subunit B
VVQGVSFALKEQVRFDRSRILTRTWEDYPILRFSEVPRVEVMLLKNEQSPSGAGECTMGPTAAAIANALHDALGVRVRDLPLTPERIAAAING